MIDDGFKFGANCGGWENRLGFEVLEQRGGHFSGSGGSFGWDGGLVSHLGRF